jgi:hypothetical protein
MICKSGALTLDGGKSLSTRESTSVISNRPIDALMLLEERILKDKRFKFITGITVPTKDGRLFMLTLLRLRLRDSMKNSDSISTDHSTLSLNFHSTELQRCTATLK